MTERYPRCYAALRRAGHSGAKAIEILLDAKRGESHAIRWVRICRGIR